MAKLFLSRHVHFCSAGETVVFLDLKNDRYSRIDGDSAAAFGALVNDPKASSMSSTELDEIVERRLLTTDASVGKAVVSTEVDCVTQRLIQSHAQSHAEYARSIAPRDVWRFVAACMTAWLKLRLRNIETIVASVEARKQRSAHLGALRLDEARRLVAIFSRLRSLFPANYVCLLDSLALVEFLALYDVFPMLVFGVRLDPWAAHCWVQEREFLFNDDVEAVADFVPIMAI